MIFVTVGTHEQPFDRLVREVDELKKDGRITEDVVMQTGFCTYEPQYCTWQKTYPYARMQELMQEARIVITHGGPSSFMMALQMGKIPIVVPRSHELSEHVNDHQIRFCEAVDRRYHCLILVEDTGHLGKAIEDYDEICRKMLRQDEPFPTGDKQGFSPAGNTSDGGQAAADSRDDDGLERLAGVGHNHDFMLRFIAIADELWEEKKFHDRKKRSSAGSTAKKMSGGVHSWRDRSEPKVCLAGSSGGHLMHLYLLKEYWEKYDHFWVTFDKPDAQGLLGGERMIGCYFPTNRSLKALLINTRLAWKVLRTERPDIIISSGAAVAVPFFYLGKLFGAKTIYVEVFDRIDSPTVTGKIVYPVADRFIVQWDSMKKVYKKAINLESIY